VGWVLGLGSWNGFVEWVRGMDPGIAPRDSLSESAFDFASKSEAKVGQPVRQPTMSLHREPRVGSWAACDTETGASLRGVEDRLGKDMAELGKGLRHGVGVAMEDQRTARNTPEGKVYQASRKQAKAGRSPPQEGAQSAVRPSTPHRAISRRPHSRPTKPILIAAT